MNRLIARYQILVARFAFLWVAILCSAVQAATADCTPDCVGKECGPNGCGGSCGLCAPWEGEVCAGGHCGTSCLGITSVGCCDGTDLLWCEDGKLESMKCSVFPSCGWADSLYMCSSSGGEDPSGTYAKECVFDCSQGCLGKNCGPDGCGGSCGVCAEGQACVEGVCCQPDCEGKECGSDGCGGFCGPKLGVDKGKCEVGARCDNGVCVADCDHECGPTQCGVGECGNYCGICREDEVCLNGVCLNGGGGIPDVGCCFENDHYAIIDATLELWAKVIDCGPNGGNCGWHIAGDPSCLTGPPGTCMFGDLDGWYDCGGQLPADPSGTYPRDCQFGCVNPPDCEGRQCGRDGCGGTCGTCSVGAFCAEGVCCVKACAGLECGDDGCGHVCGVCYGPNVCVSAANRPANGRSVERTAAVGVAELALLGRCARTATAVNRWNRTRKPWKTWSIPTPIPR